MAMGQEHDSVLFGNLVPKKFCGKSTKHASSKDAVLNYILTRIIVDLPIQLGGEAKTL